VHLKADFTADEVDGIVQKHFNTEGERESFDKIELERKIENAIYEGSWITAVHINNYFFPVAVMKRAGKNKKKAVIRKSDGQMSFAIVRSSILEEIRADGYINSLGKEREKVRNLEENIRDLRQKRRNADLQKM